MDGLWLRGRRARPALFGANRSLTAVSLEITAVLSGF